MIKDEKPSSERKEIHNHGRRKAVKTIVTGVSALAAYHVLPVNWSKPVIGQVFLPAHAQTSGEVVPDSQPEPEPEPEPPGPTCTIISVNNISEVSMIFNYRDCSSGGTAFTIVASGGSLDISVVSESYFTAAPTGHDYRPTYITGGAATALVTADLTTDIHLIGTLAAGSTGTIVIDNEAGGR